ncbi:MAG TPA: helix-turn-helix domain-containing protein, partial [Chloroflexota bacterium]|nr:helix-turn-helix domain-containing protein [Chloroflexota bacterium]
RWLDWYQRGGIGEVRRRHYRGRAPRLTRSQLKVLLDRARTQPFMTTQDARSWVESYLGVSYTHSGMRWLLERHGLKEQGRPLRRPSN